MDNPCPRDLLVAELKDLAARLERGDLGRGADFRLDLAGELLVRAMNASNGALRFCREERNRATVSRHGKAQERATAHPSPAASEAPRTRARGPYRRRRPGDAA